MGCAEHYPGRHEAGSGCRIRDAVPAEVEVFSGLPGNHGIAAAKPGHAGCGHQIFAGEMGQYAIGQHGLGLRAIKCLADNGFPAEQGNQVILCHFHAVRVNIQVRIYFP